MEAEKLKEEIVRLKDELAKERAVRQEVERQLALTIKDLQVSDHKLDQMKEALQKNLLRRTNTLTSLIKNLHAGVLLEDENRRIILINEKFCQIFQLKYEPEMLIGQSSDQYIKILKEHFEHAEAFESGTAERLESRTLYINEVLRMRNGQVLERDFLPIYSGGEWLGNLWQYREITEQFYFEEKIRRSEEKYRGIIENMELGLLEVGQDQRIVRAYNRFCTMTGYSEEELIGKQISEFLLVVKDAFSAQNGGDQSIYEAQIRTKDETSIWVLVGESPIYDDNGSLSGTMSIHYNITDRKQLERELREAREVAENARAAEKQFLANMSHEIRNPINAIAGLINLLYDTKLSEEQLDYLNNIKHAADILLSLISDILDLSKIESGKMELVEKSVDINAIIRAVVQTYSFKTSEKDLRFTLDIDPRLAQPVLVAPTVLNQILLNLIGNAVKFTDRGEVNIRAEIVSETDTSIDLEVTVTDTGIGISEDQYQKIFDNFHQADEQIKLKYGGTGLGLAIVKQLLEFYHGTIRVVSTPGKGSAFTFTLQLARGLSAQGNEQEPTLERVTPGRIQRILIVEDNKFNQQYLVGLLKTWKIRYHLANHGEEALALIDLNVYDVVLMDIRMPVMDGYETTIRIRNSQNNQNKTVPIVALTASALVDEKERAFAAGMDFHLTKPFSPDQLLRIINQISGSFSEIERNSSGFQYSYKLDQKYLQDFYEDDLDRAALMFQIFLKNIDREIDDMMDFYHQKDWRQFAAITHKIKPNFAMVGLTNYTTKMQEMEQFARKENQQRLEEIVPVFFKDFKNKRKLVEEELISIHSYMESGKV